MAANTENEQQEKQASKQQSQTRRTTHVKTKKDHQANNNPFFSQMKKSKSMDLTTWLSGVEHQHTNKDNTENKEPETNEQTKIQERKKAPFDNQALTRIQW